MSKTAAARLSRAGGGEDPEAGDRLSGAACAVAGFLIWGLSPVYWKMLGHVPVFEILSHRIFWSFVFFIPLIAISSGRRRDILRAVKSVRISATLLLTTLLVGCNWLIYIWAVNHDHVMETSLGYYMSPLVSVFLGVFFLKERLRVFQIVSIALAAAGVLFLAVHHGKFPWVSLALAFTFALYGMARKTAAVGSVPGLFIETFLLLVPAAVWMAYVESHSGGHFLRDGAGTDLLLVGSAMLTGLPLLLFTMGARRLRLSTVGFLQYLTPSCTFLLAVFIYHEPFEFARMVAFVLIWIALLIYSVDMALSNR
ncbi:Uncharacterized transporter YojE [Candidatus Desulfarcum epimagneticum]|uniref:Uncharacterized transporter YojE n=1 Tax=uncultured Desulfobacteraceae bacterium TaxID=218296 RepID=A0A484HGH7_9BACT|nr:Uncharacterized transporter YojE [uncultured Desulfobacteraceae bacterium]